MSLDVILPSDRKEDSMRLMIAAALVASIISGRVGAEDPKKEAPKVILKSPDGKKSYDLQKISAEGPVLVRLTCACSGCDAELPYFQKLQAAYNGKGFTTLAVFKEEPESLEAYVTKKDIQFFWLADPKGDLWKTFDAKTMPTNILIDKGGKVVKVIPGCTKDGRNAQMLSSEIAKLLNTKEAQIAEPKE
jgi:peroxiredoxin